MSTPACDMCGRRHGERVLVATLEPVRWGQADPRWAWLDPTPPACFRRKGPVWREGTLNRFPLDEEIRGPRTWQVVALTEYVPPRDWEYANDGAFFCQTCADYGRELVEECEFTRRPVRGARGGGAGGVAVILTRAERRAAAARAASYPPGRGYSFFAHAPGSGNPHEAARILRRDPARAADG